MQVPDSAIQVVGKMSDLASVLRAKELIVHKDIKDKKELRFIPDGEFIPLGLKQARYFGMIWKRS